MFPVLFKIGPVPIHTYGFMMAVAFLVGVHLMQRDAKKVGIDPRVIADVALYSLPLAILGARIAFISMYPGGFSLRDPIGWIALWRGGLVFQGAPVFVIPFAYYYLRKHKVPFLRAADIITPYIPLGHGIGRIGCFFYGCCYGRLTDLPWGIRFPRIPFDGTVAAKGSPAYLDHLDRFSDMGLSSEWSHAVHPTQLYSFVGLVGICGLLLLLRKRWNPYAGFTLPLYLVIYSVFRFIVEFFRGDHNPVHFLSLTDQQLFAIFFAVLGLFLFFILRGASRGGSRV